MELLPKKYSNIEKLSKDLRVFSENRWIGAGKKTALRLFHETARRVPAYKKFLKKRAVNPKTIKTISDFKKIPTTDKNNYLREHSFADLSQDGKFASKNWVIASSSGSTGEPFYFPRGHLQDEQYAATAELYLRTNFNIHKKTTLYVNCFALGVWIGGIFTYEALKIIMNKRKYGLTVINPGLNKPEILRAVRKLGPEFDQVLIGGYPPFVKDIIDEGPAEGINWKKFDLGFVFSAERFDEDFRDYIAEKTGLKNIYKDTLNHYGTVDLGTMSYETPVSVLIRRLAVKNKNVFKEIFGAEISRVPTLTQYDPEMFFFEESDGGLVCSARSGFPLVRYDLKDSGGVINFSEMESHLKNTGVNLKKEIKKAGIAETVWRLPFVYVFERKDFSVSFAGANVYPETIRRAIASRKISGILSGKFLMRIVHDKKQNPSLEINIELKKGERGPSKRIKNLAEKTILEKLLEENSEFKSAFYEQKEGKAKPKVIFWPYEHGSYFKPGGKQRWTA